MFGLIDCYIYVVFGGDWVWEFEMCLEGVFYEEIVCVGGGIVLMVRVICEVFEEELLDVVLICVDVLIVEGVMVLEIKFGYGLDMEIELCMFCVVCWIGFVCLVIVCMMFFGVYVVLLDYKGWLDVYLD